MCFSACVECECGIEAFSASAARGSWSCSSVGDGVERVVPRGVAIGFEDMV